MGATHHISLIAMGRRKIDIAYINDDRVRKVTFCKRKGGLFKKAEDLSKLCGVEVAVVIIQEGNNKICNFASKGDVEHTLKRFLDIQAHGAQAPRAAADAIVDLKNSELEQQRREIENLQRQLQQERKKVEALVGQDVSMMTVRPVDMSQMTSQMTVRPVDMSQMHGGLNGMAAANPTLAVAPAEEHAMEQNLTGWPSEPPAKKQCLEPPSTLPVVVPVVQAIE